MEKGFWIILVIGAAFIYFSISIFNTASSEDDSTWAGDTQSQYNQYYKKDIMGDRILDLNTLPIEKAKSIWSSVPESKIVASRLPDFETAKTEAMNIVAKGKFLAYLLRSIDEESDRFLVGESTADAAKKYIQELN